MSEPNAPCTPDVTRPIEQMLNICYVNFILFRSVYMIAKLGIPDLLKDGPLTSDELAEATGSHPRTLYRLLRAVSSAGVLFESEDRTFSITPLGETLRKDVPGSLRGLTIFCGEPFYLKVFEDLAHCVRTGEPAFERVLGADHFEYFEKNPEIGEIFDQAMTDWSYDDAVAVADAYDFSQVKTVMDVGGGHGILLTKVLQVYPEVRGVLFEQPHVIEGARNRFEAEGLLPRCDLVTGDFFSSIPSGSDVYIMKSILHDFDDEQCVTILKACRRAMGDTGRLLAIETVIPRPNESHFAMYQDIEMLVLLGGQERTVGEFEALFARADLRLSRVISTAGTHSIVEAVSA
jgi:hypothetical protein